jgi:hypothetical protein
MNGAGATATVTILVDDRAALPLHAEHGFAAWIEAAGRRVLFDTGAGAALGRNALRLGVPLATADALVVVPGGGFGSFGEFCAGRLRADARPVCADRGAVVSPCDGVA